MKTKTKMIFTAAIGAVALAGSAQATVVNFATDISVPRTIDGVYINFATGGTSTTENSTFDFNPYAGSGGLLFYWGGSAAPNAGVATGLVYQDLSVGSVISSASSFSQAANGASNETVNFRAPGIHTLGFKFFNEGTGAINYGYARVQAGANSGFPATVLGWSYENNGGSITVAAATSAVPETATWGMMIAGFGMMGAAMRTRRRSTKVSFA